MIGQSNTILSEGIINAHPSNILEGQIVKEISKESSSLIENIKVTQNKIKEFLDVFNEESDKIKLINQNLEEVKQILVNIKALIFVTSKDIKDLDHFEKELNSFRQRFPNLATIYEPEKLFQVKESMKRLTQLYIAHKVRKNSTVEELSNHLNKKEVKILESGANINSNKELLEDRELSEDLNLLNYEIINLSKKYSDLASLLNYFSIEIKNLNFDETSVNNIINNLSQKSRIILNLSQKQDSILSNYHSIKNFYDKSKEYQFKL